MAGGSTHVNEQDVGAQQRILSRERAGAFKPSTECEEGLEARMVSGGAAMSQRDSVVQGSLEMAPSKRSGSATSSRGTVHDAMPARGAAYNRTAPRTGRSKQAPKNKPEPEPWSKNKKKLLC